MQISSHAVYRHLLPDKAALQAGKVMLGQIEHKVRQGESFAFETTLSGVNYVRHIRNWRNAKYHVKLVFLSLPTADLAVARVQSRVEQGGHMCLGSVIRGRFHSGLKHFQTIYRTLVNSWVLYDNAGSTLN